MGCYFSRQLLKNQISDISNLFVISAVKRTNCRTEHDNPGPTAQKNDRTEGAQKDMLAKDNRAKSRTIEIFRRARTVCGRLDINLK